MPNIQIAKMVIWQNGNFNFGDSDILPEKKEYAKLAIPLSGSKGKVRSEKIWKTTGF
jgi:hypothetical protein